MLRTNKIKKVTILAATLAVTVIIPTGLTHASPLNSSGMINSIFDRVGLERNTSVSNNQNQSTNGQQVQQKPPVQENTKPESSTNTKPESSNNSQQVKQANTSLANKIIQTGEKYLGTPYRFGSPSGVTSTFDCSSFVQHVYKKNGINLPRNSRQQSTVGTTVPKSQLQKGDLLFFKTKKSNGRVAHVGIYAGNNKVLHTWGPGGVKYDSLSTPWLKQGYLHAKRVIK
ncbi:C40 family peptidase [Hazenella coriacea]|uniref:Cell wall-associated NlpC family hydrolase n=1 Tax=Hazenella coriacea TaxID=1179467 RepID=A0A4R3LC09_9BACL|nr:C40 family peptidase [Hazenella coriacea]TCS96780.1 cell wall-associated NlpC family hydrolase [Hazenella coriacea]